MNRSDRQPPVPLELRYEKSERILHIRFREGEEYSLSAEYLRVYSPSAEVRGHGPGQETLQTGKEEVGIKAIEPVGNYAVRLCFDDGHDTGLYSFEELYRLGEARQDLWQDYLDRLEAAGHRRREL